MITNSIFLEVGNLDGLVFILFLILLVPPILLSIVGFILFKNQKRIAGKIFFILAGVYLLIGLGICGVLLTGI